MNNRAIGRSWKQAKAELFTPEEIAAGDLRVEKILASIQAREEKNATKIHLETGKILHRDIRPFEFKFRGEKIVVDMPGWYPEDNDDGIFTQEDMKIAGEVLRKLKARHAEKLTENISAGKVAFA